VAVTVLIGGRIHVGVIDLNDPSGLWLRLLFLLNNNVSYVVVATPLLQRTSYICVYSNSITLHLSYFTLQRGLFGSLDTHIVWHFLHLT
jgi:hypothetical protein